jgi:hypothetical protein
VFPVRGDEERNGNTVVDALTRVAASVASGADRNFVLRLITRTTRRLVDCDVAAAALLDPTDGVVTVAQNGSDEVGANPFGPALFVPIVVDEPRGWLCVSRFDGGAAFTKDELAVVRLFAVNAGAVLERDQRRRRNEELKRVAEQWQLAQELQTLVGEQLSRVSFDLSGVLHEIGDERTRERVVHAIDDLDHAVKITRQIAFGLMETKPV